MSTGRAVHSGAVDRQERIAIDQRRCLDQPTACLHQHRALVRDGHFEPVGAAGEMRFPFLADSVNPEEAALGKAPLAQKRLRPIA